MNYKIHFKDRSFQLSTKHVVAVLLILALLSAFVLGGIFSNPQTYQKQIQSLNKRQATVMALAATSVASSTAVSMFPDDIGTPIANELADMSTYLLIILSAILLEKYLMAIFGALAFGWLFPIALVLYSAYLVWGSRQLKTLAKKLALFALVIVLTIPISVSLADMIQEVYDISAEPPAALMESIQEVTIPEGNTEQDGTDQAPGENWFTGAWETVTNKVDQVGSSIVETFSGLTEGLSNKLDEAKNMVNHLMESIAVMIVTCCVIPIGVVIFLLWIVKMIFGLNFDRDQISSVLETSKKDMHSALSAPKKLISKEGDK